MKEGNGSLVHGNGSKEFRYGMRDRPGAKCNKSKVDHLGMVAMRSDPKGKEIMELELPRREGSNYPKPEGNRTEAAMDYGAWG